MMRVETMGKGDIPSSLNDDLIIPLPIAISFLLTKVRQTANGNQGLVKRRCYGLGLLGVDAG